MKDEELIKKVLELSKFKELNPVQKEALKKGLLKRKNLVIAAPTASGKTLIAEIASLSTFFEKLGKTVYIVPLVALASEKYKEFKEKYTKLGIKVAISVGDLDSSDPWLANYDLIVCTTEKLDSLIRHEAEWIKDIGLIVADEIHLLNDASRGPTLEITLTRLREIVPNVQVLALSATIRNAKELAKWLNAETVISEWRPVKLYKGVSYPYQIKFLNKEGYELDSALPLEESIVRDTLNLRKQALIFVSTRKSAESLAEKLGKIVKQHLLKNEVKELEKLANEVENVLEVPTQQCKRIAKCIKLGCAFHHAGLCLPYDARVQLADGRLVEIGKLVEECPKGVEVLSLNLKTFCFEPRRIKNYIKLPSPSEMIKITTRSKKNIIVTLNHPFLTIENGKVLWKKASFLKVNDYIAAPRIVKSKSTSKLTAYLANVPESLKTYKYDVIPQTGSILKKIRERAKLSFSQIQKFYPATTWWRIEKNRNPITRQNLKKLVKSLENLKLSSIRKELSFLKKLFSSELIWEKITKIEKIKSKDPYVYDLSIEGSYNFVANNIVVHNTYKQKSLIEENFKNRLIKIIVATPTLAYGVSLPAFRVIMRDLKRYHPGIGAIFVPILEVQQMLGRAGRPQYDVFGEGIILAKNEEEAEELIEHYIYGEPEKITSKLAAEPILRMHVLALIASEFCKSKKSLRDFFSKTFFAFQYGSIAQVEEKLFEILSLLKKWKFIEIKRDKLIATRIGKRVSELYIDPLTAHYFIECLSGAMKKEIQPFSFLQTISNTIEMKPLLSIRSGEFSELNEEIAKRENLFLQKIPEEYDLEFDEFLRSVKTALMFEAWINEATEDQILTKFRVTPGELMGRKQIADWLVYSLQELALLLGFKKILKEIRKLRVRLLYGVKEELLPLVRLKDIGRVRSRKLFSAGLKSLQKLREIPLESLSRIIGPKIAYSIKEQLGQVEKKQKEEKQVTLRGL